MSLSTLSTAKKQLLADAAKMSWLSYSSPEVVQQQFGKRSKAAAKPFDVLQRVDVPPRFVSCKACDAQCYMLQYTNKAADDLNSKPVLAISARGTTSLMDWLSDVEFMQEPFKDCNGKSYPGARVHHGFQRQFLGLAAVFDTQVKQHLKAGNHLLCTGHSLAGSLSSIAAAHYALGYPGQVWHVSFGSPRTGNDAFAQLYNKSVLFKHRVKNSSDPVVSIIPPVNYAHVDSELHIGPPDQYPELPVLLDIADHDISKYTADVENPAAASESKSATTRDWLQGLMERG